MSGQVRERGRDEGGVGRRKGEWASKREGEG